MTDNEITEKILLKKFDTCAPVLCVLAAYGKKNTRAMPDVLLSAE